MLLPYFEPLIIAHLSDCRRWRNVYQFQSVGDWCIFRNVWFSEIRKFINYSLNDFTINTVCSNHSWCSPGGLKEFMWRLLILAVTACRLHLILIPKKYKFYTNRSRTHALQYWETNVLNGQQLDNEKIWYRLKLTIKLFFVHSRQKQKISYWLKITLQSFKTN